MPTRDELTKAWGDTLLAQLEKPAQIYLANGRFTEVSDAAVLALPDAGLLARAARFTADAEAVMARYFGRPVPLRLALDTPNPSPAQGPPFAGRARDEDDYDFEELADAPAAPAVTAEQLILEAFPGAVMEA